MKVIQWIMDKIAFYAVGLVSRYCIVQMDCERCALQDVCERIKHGFDEPHHWTGPWPGGEGN